MNYNKSVWVDVFSEKDFRRYRKGRIVAKLINIGFGNVVNSDKIIAVVSPEAAPVKRMVQRAKESNRIIDATQGRRTKAVLITGEEFIILSALQPETISRRFNGGWETEKELCAVHLRHHKRPASGRGRRRIVLFPYRRRV